jgi:hypothetical protein
LTADVTFHKKPTTRAIKLLAALALLGLLTACGSHPAADFGSTTSARLAQGLKFSACMRSHGVTQFPDPDAAGQLTIDGIANGSGLNPNSPTFIHALTACKGLEPAGFTGQPRSTQQQNAALKFAQCVRNNGVPDFPDPVNGQPLIDTNTIPSAATASGLSALNTARQKCQSLAAAAIGSSK